MKAHRIERVLDTQVQRQEGEGTVRVVRTVEVEETLTITQIQGLLQAAEQDVAMFHRQIAQTEARIAQYRALLAQHYGETAARGKD